MQIANGSTDVTTYFTLRDSTAHAPKTDVMVTDIDLYYVEERAAISAKADATALAAADSAHGDNQAYHVGQGLYRIDWPDAAFDGGIGKKVQLIVVCTGVDTTFLEVELSPASNVVAVGSDAQSATDLKDFADTGYDPSTHKVAGVVLTDTCTTNTDLVSAASIKTAIEAAGSHLALILEDTGTTLDTLINDIPTVSEFEARTIAAADYLVASDTLARVTLVDTCTTNTDMRGTDSASTHSAADVKTALEADGSKLDHLWEMTEDDGGVRRLTTNALEQAPAGGTGLDAAGVRAAIGLATANLDTQLDAIPTAAENADAVLDEMLSEHTDVGSSGAGIAAAGSSGDPWATALPGAYAAGTAGNIIGSLSTPGSGSNLRVYSLTEATSGNPIVGATVTVTTDIAGTVVVASGTTDSGGIVEFYLDAGTYYLWRSCTGYTFTDPDTEVFV
ncbi:hypothetical protein M0R72_14055 [Candidatus Pacearchaeota archaeon]|jgi:hypothetical protein|nr:hypothetical protein [Candidatus Pacearchaeota archaeon]